MQRDGLYASGQHPAVAPSEFPRAKLKERCQRSRIVELPQRRAIALGHAMLLDSEALPQPPNMLKFLFRQFEMIASNCSGSVR